MAIENFTLFSGTRASIWAMLSGLIKREVLIIPNAGAPSDGTSGTGAGRAGKGSLLVDYTNGTLYQNTGTKASPTWSTRT